MLEKIMDTYATKYAVRIGTALVISAGLYLAGCGDDNSGNKSEGCDPNFQSNGAYLKSLGDTSVSGTSLQRGVSFLQATSQCPPGCSLIGENEKKYCCSCPDANPPPTSPCLQSTQYCRY